MKRIPQLSAVFFSLLLAAIGSQALPIVSYDFSGTDGPGPAGNPLGLAVGVLGPSISVTVDGLTVEVIGKDFDPTPGPSALSDVGLV